MESLVQFIYDSDVNTLITNIVVFVTMVDFIGLLCVAALSFTKVGFR